MLCENCGGEFERHRSNQIYCSVACRNKRNSMIHYHDNTDKEKQRFQRYRRSGATAYNAIKQRCGNPGHIAFQNYGGKGVKCLINKDEFLKLYNTPTVCKICKWELNEDGSAPDGRTIDRINSDGNYEVDNVRIVCRSCNSRLTKSRKTIGLKSGCWTLLHDGHASALRFAASQCDWLIVLTNSDDRLAAKRGCVPLPLYDRMKLLSSLSYVDEVDWFSQRTEEEWVQKFKDQRFDKEFEEGAKLIVFHDPVIENSGHVPCQTIADEIVFIPYTPSAAAKTSVSQIFKLIKDHGV